MFYDYMNFIELTLTEDEFLLEKKTSKSLKNSSEMFENANSELSKCILLILSKSLRTNGF